MNRFTPVPKPQRPTNQLPNYEMQTHNLHTLFFCAAAATVAAAGSNTVALILLGCSLKQNFLFVPLILTCP